MLRSDVSVALCTYNGEAFLQKQLDSILTQTYAPFEVIIVDDNSTDSTREILISYQERYPFIKVYLNEANVGFNQNFEKAISLASGEYICLSDQDDVWYPDKIKTLLENIGENWLIFSNSEIINLDETPTGKNLLNHFKFSDDYKSILFENFVTGHTCLMNRDLKKYIFPLPLKGYYDWWLGFIALYHHKLVYLDQVLTKYRVHEGSVIQKAFLSKSKGLAKYNLDLQLGLFSRYSNLKGTDRDFITALKVEIKEPKNPLLKSQFLLLVRNMSLFFPQKKEKSIFSKILFVFKYLKMHQN